MGTELTSKENDKPIVAKSSDKKSEKKKARNRCKVCRKKNLTNIKCKCGEIVCMAHRFPDSHKCTFNHALYEKALLRDNLQKVVASKMEVV